MCSRVHVTVGTLVSAFLRDRLSKWALSGFSSGTPEVRELMDFPSTGLSFWRRMKTWSRRISGSRGSSRTEMHKGGDSDRSNRRWNNFLPVAPNVPLRSDFTPIPVSQGAEKADVLFWYNYRFLYMISVLFFHISSIFSTSHQTFFSPNFSYFLENVIFRLI